jgi:hypothetical protein
MSELYRNPPDAVRYLEQWEEFHVEGVRRPNHNVRSMFSIKEDDWCVDDPFGAVTNDGFCQCSPHEGFMEFGPTPESDEKYADYWLKSYSGWE